MDKHPKKLIPEDKIGYFPITFQYLKSYPAKIKANEWTEKPKLIPIDFYQTTQYKTHSFYKPLSKIIHKPK